MATNLSPSEVAAAEQLVIEIEKESGISRSSWDLQSAMVAAAAMVVCKRRLLEEIRNSLERRGIDV